MIRFIRKFSQKPEWTDHLGDLGVDASKLLKRILNK
jgi:hypothetical protein